MGDRIEAVAGILSILSKIKGCEINDIDENIFEIKCNYISGETLDVYIKLRRRYHTKLNLFIVNINEFTVYNFADALKKAC